MQNFERRFGRVEFDKNFFIFFISQEEEERKKEEEEEEKLSRGPYFLTPQPSTHRSRFDKLAKKFSFRLIVGTRYVLGYVRSETAVKGKVFDGADVICSNVISTNVIGSNAMCLKLLV